MTTIDQKLRELRAMGLIRADETELRSTIFTLESLVRSAIRAECQLQEHRELGEAILRRLKA